MVPCFNISGLRSMCQPKQMIDLGVEDPSDCDVNIKLFVGNLFSNILTFIE